MVKIMFGASYDRTGVIEIVEGKCEACGETTRVLSSDTSDGEYGEACICRTCIENLFIEDAIAG